MKHVRQLHRHIDRGSAAIETAILAPPLLALIALAIVGGRIQIAGGAIESAAHDAARAASISRTADAARTNAATAAAASLDQAGLHCTTLTVGVDTAGFDIPVGEPASVTVSVTCRVDLSDLVADGLPGVQDTHLNVRQRPRPVPGKNMTPRRPSHRSDDGRITLLVLVLAFAVLAMIGLSVDGGGKLRALARADNIAAEAARAGGQAIVVPQAIEGGPKELDPATAVNAAQSYLNAAGVTGTVGVAQDRQHITVTVSITYSTVFLGLIGIDQLDVTRSATAELVTA